MRAQIDDLERALPQFGWFGVGRSAARDGEHCAVLYRRERLEVLAESTFWLSTTPDVAGSVGWDATRVRAAPAACDDRAVTATTRTLGAVLASALALAPSALGAGSEARVSLDLKDAPVVDIVSVLAEVGGFQVVIDPGISCRLTLKINDARWRTVLDTALSACGLGREEEDDILRIATVAKLRQEAEARRKLDEERRTAPVGRLESFRLSYARAQEVAPLLAKVLPPTARATYDARTNTLILIY